jgi:hypothetical protein
MKNVTFTIDEKLLERAREKARNESSSLNVRFQEWLEKYVGETEKKEEFHSMMNRLNYVDSGGKFSREEMNERR